VLPEDKPLRIDPPPADPEATVATVREPFASVTERTTNILDRDQKLRNSEARWARSLLRLFFQRQERIPLVDKTAERFASKPNVVTQAATLGDVLLTQIPRRENRIGV